MKKKRYSVETIVSVLKQADQGTPVAEITRKLGISEQTYYRWKKTYSGLESDQVRELKQLQEENTRLKRVVAELTLDKVMLQDVLQKAGQPDGRRPIVSYLMAHYVVSERHACEVVRQSRRV